MSKCRFCSYMDLSDKNKYGDCYCSYKGHYYDPDSSGCEHNTNDTDGKDHDTGCYLTTAMCQILGKADNCYELETLRSFRENYMRMTDEGKELLKEYDIISPPIASKLLKLKNKMDIANIMLCDYINTSIELINNNDNEAAIIKYKDMVLYLKKLLRM